jgi:hypothetical protein
MARYSVPGLEEFLQYYPGMAIRPTPEAFLTLKGVFEFSAKPDNGELITDSYNLTITVPEAFPKRLPCVFETESRILRDGNHHTNANGTLCLGSPLRLLWQLSQSPTLTGFADKCLIPFLYSISHKTKFGGEFPFSELPHGTPGELSDYAELFGLKDTKQVRTVLRLLSMKKRIANKYPCPCGCGRKLGQCRYNDKLNAFRDITDRSWFRSKC